MVQMKIKLTEEQYRKFVLENTNRNNFMDKVYKEIENKDIEDVFPLIVDTYGFSVDEILEDEMSKRLYDEGYDKEAIQERMEAAKRSAFNRQHSHHGGCG